MILYAVLRVEIEEARKWDLVQATPYTALREKIEGPVNLSQGLTVTMAGRISEASILWL